MRLRRLTLHGFKSFADRTELVFHDGITAVVGPNGCGKSNIGDAIRWVLGEQRASAIRGSRMEEAIFQGTTERRAVNRAEVALTFSNEDGALPVPYEEVEIRRTLFREGGSEYELNRAPCRLRDILDLFRDTGVGANSYTVIEQGMVDAILSERAEERRAMFEEAAGIGRYKDRRRAAERRLEATEADLARLQDIIGEVESKVRSLARQRRKAQRYQELRARRLALDLRLASIELDELRAALQEATERLATLAQEEPAARAALGAAEAELERVRLEAAELGRARSGVASRLEEVSRRIAERERELAVAGERRTHAERRLAQIASERSELRGRANRLEGELSTLEGERAEQDQAFQALSRQVEEAQKRQQALRQELTAARQADEQARAREKDLTRRLSRLEADAAAAEARAAEAAGRLERLQAEKRELEQGLAKLDDQGDLFAERARALAAAQAEVQAQRDALAAQLEALRAQEAEARRALIEAEDRANRLAARVAALEALEREYHGFAPVVAQALAARGQLDGLLGPLADYLRLPPERAAAFEAALGALLQTLIVRDGAAVEKVRQWLAEQEPAQGVLALLPREALPRLEALLAEIEFAGEPASEPVILGRQERLARLRQEADEAARERDERDAARAAIAQNVQEAEAALRELEGRLQQIGLELRQAEADEAARTGQRARLQRALEDLERRRTELRAQAEQAQELAARAREERSKLEAELASHREAWQQAAEALARREAAWEAARDEEAELRVAHARAESALATVNRRLTSARDGLAHARRRLQELDREEADHRRALEQLAALRSEASGQLEELFALRDAATAELRTLDERLAATSSAASELESRIRSLRRAADEQNEERHRLELRATELEAATRRVRERVEAEWGRPYEQLLELVERAQTEPAAPADAEDGEDAEGESSAERRPAGKPLPDTVEGLRAELQAVTADLERLGPINMLAMEEYEEESKRLEFLRAQHADLLKAREDLATAIRQTNRTARQLFLETFEQVRANFRRTFETLFEGGDCDLWLADPEDPLESDIEVSASPRGKRTQRIHLLSGGERALTALALLFAIYLVKPSPFCVLDEVDAPLDEANVERFIAMLQRFKAGTQFIVITHNPRTMEAADWIYGVTMEEPGVSSIVGVRVDGALSGASVESRS